MKSEYPVASADICRELAIRFQRVVGRAVGDFGSCRQIVRCLFEFEPLLAVAENFSNVIERDDLAFLWRLVELLPIEVRRWCETSQLPMPCRAGRVFAIGIFRIEKNN